jgi:5-methylcytosine-specific restriction endonuclease McrA
MHYQRWETHGDPLTVIAQAKHIAQCDVQGCDRIAFRRGLCNAHDWRVRVTGDALRDLPIQRKRLGRTEACSADGCERPYAAAGYCKMHYMREWGRAHPESRIEHVENRRARMQAVFVEYVRRDEVFRRDKGQCGICGAMVDPADWHLDHILPVSRGGEHSYANVQVTHPDCNRAKGARLISHQVRLF